MKRTHIFHFVSLVLLLGSLFAPITSSAAQPAIVTGGGIFVVNSPADDIDKVQGDGLCQTAQDTCTLRAAIQEANAYPGPDTIQFGLPGTGMQLIFVNSALPPITQQLTIDASTQTNCTLPCVILNGRPLGDVGTAIGLDVQTDYSTVRGLIITSFYETGIRVNGNGNTIQGNTIGFLPGFATPLPNGTGISVVGSGNLIGGTAAGTRNVVSGNRLYGITLGGGTALTYGNTIQKNVIGLDRTGLLPLGNGAHGIYVLSDASYTLIGGTVTAARNVISANGLSGISNTGTNTTIQGNFIGTTVKGSGNMGNAEYGIITAGPMSLTTTIGGTVKGAANRIFFNGLAGIGAAPGMTAPQSIHRNRIFRNGGLGIDLGNDGVTPNDALDADTGTNGLQNFPELVSATSATLTIVGALNSKASTTYLIEFYVSPATSCDPSGYGEGNKFLGQTSVTTDGAGLAAFQFVSVAAFPAGSVITATATDPDGNTSEFSACMSAG